MGTIFITISFLACMSILSFAQQGNKVVAIYGNSAAGFKMECISKTTLVVVLTTIFIQPVKAIQTIVKIVF
jgi:hypothetical protein